MSNHPHDHPAHRHSHSHGRNGPYGTTLPVFSRRDPLPWGGGPHPMTGRGGSEVSLRPDPHNFYDSDHAKLMATLDLVQLRYSGRDDVDLEIVRREIIDRCADAGWVVSVVGQVQRRADGTWDARRDGLGYQVIVEGRCEPEAEFDHERKAFEVINDVGGIEPDKKGLTIDPNGLLRSAPTTFPVSTSTSSDTSTDTSSDTPAQPESSE